MPYREVHARGRAAAGQLGPVAFLRVPSISHASPFPGAPARTMPLTTTTAVPTAATAGWCASRLRRYAAALLDGRQLVLVSQRQPVIFGRSPGRIDASVPAGGLVTALLPLARGCGATWVSESTGDADAQMADRRGQITMFDVDGIWRMQPTPLPESLRRAHCDGFSNGGLWPACHGASVPLRFAESDWRAYREVNARFADSVCQALQESDAVVHIHDYHLCLLPQLLRARVPAATLVHFWHIPWPDPVGLRRCPWFADLVRGLAAADALVFQTPDDAGRFRLACRLINLRPRAVIRSVPISIAWPLPRSPDGLAPGAGIHADIQTDIHDSFQQAPATKTVKCVLGVDRFDYAKGLLERLAGFERLLERQPQWRGRVTLLQVAAPTREAVPAYQAYRERVLQRVDAINQAYGSAGWLPVEWRMRTHSPAELTTLYRAADVCLVSSLQDGMNLVCKEYAAARDDESGCLVLSRSAGAAREMTAAVLIEPRDADDVAVGLQVALSMSRDEQRTRMRALRDGVRNFNVHRWAARLLAAGPSAVLRRQRVLRAAADVAQAA